MWRNVEDDGYPTNNGWIRVPAAPATWGVSSPWSNHVVSFIKDCEVFSHNGRHPAQWCQSLSWIQWILENAHANFLLVFPSGKHPDSKCHKLKWFLHSLRQECCAARLAKHRWCSSTAHHPAAIWQKMYPAVKLTDSRAAFPPPTTSLLFSFPTLHLYRLLFLHPHHSLV